MKRIKSDKIIVGDKTQSGNVYFDNGVIEEVSEKDYDCEKEYDFTGKYVSPGFIDIHTHGGGGHPFMNGCAEEVAEGCDFHLKFGTTSIVPTVSAGKIEVMEKAVADISEAKRRKLSKTNILGAHLEGPYLSKAQCGAQCPAFITPPIKGDYRRIVERFGGDIVRWTFAPENDDGEFCSYLTDSGIIASIGHSDAKYSDVIRAVKNGSNLVTHLYSCTSTVTRDHGFRSLGVIESSFLLDELNVEIIADGKHLPKELAQMILKVKRLDKVIAVTDSLEIAGTDIKSGTMSGTDFIVEDGICKLKDRSAFAGSVATADVLVRFLGKECLLPLPDAVKPVTENPARLLGLKKGRIDSGFDADIIVFDNEIRVSDVFVGGERIADR